MAIINGDSSTGVNYFCSISWFHRLNLNSSLLSLHCWVGCELLPDQKTSTGLCSPMYGRHLFQVWRENLFDTAPGRQSDKNNVLTMFRWFSNNFQLWNENLVQNTLEASSKAGSIEMLLGQKDKRFLRYHSNLIRAQWFLDFAADSSGLDWVVMVLNFI